MYILKKLLLVMEDPEQEKGRPDNLVSNDELADHLARTRSACDQVREWLLTFKNQLLAQSLKNRIGKE